MDSLIFLVQFLLFVGVSSAKVSVMSSAQEEIRSGGINAFEDAKGRLLLW